MTTAEQIVDAEIVDDVRNTDTTVTEIAVRERVELVVTRIRPAVDTVKTRGPRWAWSAVKFVLLALSLDLWRGLCTWRRVWWSWKTLAPQTARSMAGGKSAGVIEDKLQERREKRTVQTVVGLVMLCIGVALFWWLAPVEYRQYAGIALVVALFLSGHAWRRADDAPRDERPPGYDGSIESVRRAFKGAKITGKDQSVWYAKGTRPEPVGEGIQLVLDLDSGITWVHVAQKKGPVASGFGVDGDFIVVEKGEHTGQAKLWFAEQDPYRHGPARSPLMEVERWDCWKPAPFGKAPHGFEVPLTLMYSNYLGGGVPGSGKSWTGRAVAAPFMLDPSARVFVANGKGCGAWKPLQAIAGDFYLLGTRGETMQRLADMLDMVIDEMDQRNAYAEQKGASKIVPQDGFPPWLVIVDELQFYTGCSTPSGIKRGNKELTWGEVVTDKLIILAKGARSSAIILALMTQKPGEKSLPTDLRDSIGTRFANRVSNATTSMQILGLTTADGVDASTLPAKHTGIGILKPDAELANAVSGYPVLRPYTIDDADWKRLGERAYELRREAGTHGYVRLSEQDAVPLPELLQAILDEVAELGPDDRVPSRQLRVNHAPEMSDKKFGSQLRKWGCPTGRDNGKQAMGPKVRDIRAAAQRIREGGRIEVAQAA